MIRNKLKQAKFHRHCIGYYLPDRQSTISAIQISPETNDKNEFERLKERIFTQLPLS